MKKNTEDKQSLKDKFPQKTSAIADLYAFLNRKMRKRNSSFKKILLVSTIVAAGVSGLLILRGKLSKQRNLEEKKKSKDRNDSTVKQNKTPRTHSVSGGTVSSHKPPERKAIEDQNAAASQNKEPSGSVLSQKPPERKAIEDQNAAASQNKEPSGPVLSQKPPERKAIEDQNAAANQKTLEHRAPAVVRDDKMPKAWQEKYDTSSFKPMAYWLEKPNSNKPLFVGSFKPSDLWCHYGCQAKLDENSTKKITNEIKEEIKAEKSSFAFMRTRCQKGILDGGKKIDALYIALYQIEVLIKLFFPGRLGELDEKMPLHDKETLGWEKRSKSLNASINNLNNLMNSKEVLSSEVVFQSNQTFDKMGKEFYKLFELSSSCTKEVFNRILELGGTTSDATNILFLADKIISGKINKKDLEINFKKLTRQINFNLVLFDCSDRYDQ
ncbi:MAG: hypothetical protein LBH37_00425 [Oscillospiraceae bacterium]|jgi:hypothetical protein|nr:hypothetical protein [Oscillospiraceae bacterium]